MLCLRKLGRKTLENDFLEEAVDFAKAKKWIARSPSCSGSIIETGLRSPRRSRSKNDDSAAQQAIRSVVHDLASFNYRRVRGVLRLNGMPDGRPINHKRVYRIMRDHHLLLYRPGQRPVNQRRHDGKM
ncbi:IS3 family transposase [Noviherbaspirillum sp. Root189]|uniref:IS3 family transposase n=1 Tax=Noviherbaspirillum sp. Root189 TaxID=1736487 RepID=UPI0009EADD20